MGRQREERIVVVMRVADAPPSTAVRKRGARCDICNAKVWVSRTSPRAARYRCFRCAVDTIPGDAKFEPLTEAQKAEIAAALSKRRN